MGTGSSLTNKQQLMPHNSVASRLADLDEQEQLGGSASKRSIRQRDPPPEQHPHRKSLSRAQQGSTQHLNLDLLDESLDEARGQQSSNPFRASKKSSEDASEQGSGQQTKVIKISKRAPHSESPDLPRGSKASEKIIVIEDLSKADA